MEGRSPPSSAAVPGSLRMGPRGRPCFEGNEKGGGAGGEGGKNAQARPPIRVCTNGQGPRVFVSPGFERRRRRVQRWQRWVSRSWPCPGDTRASHRQQFIDRAGFARATGSGQPGVPPNSPGPAQGGPSDEARRRAVFRGPNAWPALKAAPVPWAGPVSQLFPSVEGRPRAFHGQHPAPSLGVPTAGGRTWSGKARFRVDCVPPGPGPGRRAGKTPAPFRISDFDGVSDWLGAGPPGKLRPRARARPLPRPGEGSAGRELIPVSRNRLRRPRRIRAGGTAVNVSAPRLPR